MTPSISAFLASHDFGLVLLSAALAVLGSFITLVLFSQARSAEAETRRGWVFLSAFAAGALAWTTHFVAMLAFKHGAPVGFAPQSTSVSFFVAVLFAAFAFGLALKKFRGSGILGGVLLGLGTLGMYAMAMSGYNVGGLFTWNSTLIVLASGILVAACGFALFRASTIERHAHQVTAPLVLAAGLFAFHMVSHLAIMAEPVRGMDIPADSIPPQLLGYFVAAMSLLLFGTGIATVMIVRGARRDAIAQLRDVTDAAVEGLILTDGDTVLDYNQSLLAMTGEEKARSLVGNSVWTAIHFAGDRGEKTFEAHLMTQEGPIPVEVITRDADTSGAVRRIFAVRDLRERRAAEQRIRYLAHFDTLTGLPNRASFQDKFEGELAATRARGGELAVLVLDLDRFKDINDVHGHAAGDELLKAVSGRIDKLLSHNEFVARLGGDEFVVLQSAHEQPAGAGLLAERLIELFVEPFEVYGQRFHIGLTIGIAVHPRDGSDTRTLLANADLALYRAKGDGRGSASFFTPEMDEAVRQRRVLAQELKLAIENNELSVHYQAQATVSSGEIVGFEALARWNHPRRGYIPPTEFVAIAEESDLILDLGEWMLRTVCREAANWTRPYVVAVNVSAVQFKKANLPELIHTILLETGMPANRLELEITETALIDDLQRALDMLRRIKALGVAIAMDDFGTGYSSLSTLQAFPFDKIKIDKSFVDKIGSRQQAAVIVTAVLGLGKSLEIPVLAEGVETEIQLSFLNQEQCDQAQGFLFGRPVALDEIRDIVFDRGTSAQVLERKDDVTERDEDRLAANG